MAGQATAVQLVSLADPPRQPSPSAWPVGSSGCCSSTRWSSCPSRSGLAGTWLRMLLPPARLLVAFHWFWVAAGR